MEPKAKRHILILLAAAATMIYLYGIVDYTVEPYSEMDLMYYRPMAQASPRLADSIPRPYAYRFLGPWMAGLLPGPDPEGFLALTVLVSLMIPIALYGFLVEAGIGRSSAFLAALLFLFNKHLYGTSVWNVFQLKDSIGLLCIAACSIAMLRGNWPFFSIALLAGILSGETPIIMIPVLIVYLLERRRPAAEWRRAALSVVPGIAGFILLRLLIDARGGSGLIEAFLYHIGKLRYPLVWVGLLVNPFVPLVFLPLLHIKDLWRFMRSNIYLLACFVFVLGSAAFGANNERLMAPAFIAFYAFIGIVAERYWRGRPWIASVIVAACLIASAHHMMARYPLPSRAVTRAIAAAATLVVTLASYLSSRSQSGTGLGRNLAP